MCSGPLALCAGMAVCAIRTRQKSAQHFPHIFHTAVFHTALCAYGIFCKCTATASRCLLGKGKGRRNKYEWNGNESSGTEMAIRGLGKWRDGEMAGKMGDGPQLCANVHVCVALA